MTQTAYEILALLERHFQESVALLKQLTSCPGQRSDILIPLSNELCYVRAQIGYEATERASDFEMQSAHHWGRVHREHEESQRDPDEVYLEVEEREEVRRRKGLTPRVILLPWSYEEEEKLLAAKRAKARKNRKAKSKIITHRSSEKAAKTP
jgi:hypothetical protein